MKKFIIDVNIILEIMHYNYLLVKRFAIKFFKDAIVLVVILFVALYFAKFINYVIENHVYLLNNLSK